MDTAERSENHYALVICERNTGIVLNPDSLERWTERRGGKRRIPASSLEEARQVAAGIVAVRSDLEVVIIGHEDEFVEVVNSQ
jgi:hypothetical protein